MLLYKLHYRQSLGGPCGIIQYSTVENPTVLETKEVEIDVNPLEIEGWDYSQVEELYLRWENELFDENAFIITADSIVTGMPKLKTLSLIEPSLIDNALEDILVNSAAIDITVNMASIPVLDVQKIAGNRRCGKLSLRLEACTINDLKHCYHDRKYIYITATHCDINKESYFIENIGADMVKSKGKTNINITNCEYF